MQLAFASVLLFDTVAGESGAYNASGSPGCTAEAVVLLQAKQGTPVTDGKERHSSHISGLFHAVLSVNLKLPKAANLVLHDLAEDPAVAAEQMAIYAEIFDDVDTDHDGVITAKELESVMASLGSKPPTEAEIQDWINTVDPDGGGTIDFSEFTKLMNSHLTETSTEQSIREAFHLFDKDGDGQITPAEVQKAMDYLGNEMTTEELEDMLEVAEKDGGGYINYEEFIKLMNKARHRDPNDNP